MNYKKKISLLSCFVLLNSVAYGENVNTIDNEITPVKVIDSLTFESDKNYEIRTSVVNDKKIQYRAYEGIGYVKNIVDEKYQSINIYIPMEYYENGTINGYTAKTAPIFLPNSVGGYMPGEAGTIEGKKGPMNSGVTAAAYALSKGYIVAAPGARGRTNKSDKGINTGKAPAGLIDLKAAVKYLHYNDANMPGDANKIISNGTSAGGAMSALLGATGDSSDYESYFAALGAAEASDAIFAVSAYCPITNLDHADSAYEWSYGELAEYTPHKMGGLGQHALLPEATMGNRMAEKNGNHAELPAAELGGLNKKKDNEKNEKVQLTSYQIFYSGLLKEAFPNYVNSLQLKDGKGNALELATDGTGTFLNYAKSFIIDSANKAKSKGEKLDVDYLIYDNDQIIDVDWLKYNKAVGRMKTPGAFDAPDLSTGENDEFGTTTIGELHFTEFVAQHGNNSVMADKKIIKMMNPMYYIDGEGSKKASYWRIRYGEADNNTSMAIPLILATKLKNSGYEVDFAMPWQIGHSGDYDLEDLFAWTDKIVKGTN